MTIDGPYSLAAFLGDCEAVARLKPLVANERLDLRLRFSMARYLAEATGCAGCVEQIRRDAFEAMGVDPDAMFAEDPK